MRNTTLVLLVGVVMSTAALPAEAQRAQPRVSQPPRTQQVATVTSRVPEQGTIAVAGSVSPTRTDSAFLDNDLGFEGNVEGYLSRNVSLRAQAGTASWDITGLSFDGTLRPIYGLANVVVGWNAADWRPYVTGGGGLYRYQFTEAGVDGHNTKAGYDVGGGVEYFFSPEATVTFETLFHRVELVPTNRAALGFRGSFWAFSVGAKKYF